MTNSRSPTIVLKVCLLLIPMPPLGLASADGGTSAAVQMPDCKLLPHRRPGTGNCRRARLRVARGCSQPHFPIPAPPGRVLLFLQIYHGVLVNCQTGETRLQGQNTQKNTPEGHKTVT